jgi:hypothetical protein
MKDSDVAVLDDYTLLFVQRFPKFGKKSFKKGAKWTTIHRPLSNKMIKDHLRGEYAIGTIGRWYPEYGVIDIDDREIEEVDEIRDKLGMDSSNSMLCSSESKDSYHLLFKPKLNEKPPTLERLNDDFKGFCSEHNVEIYPQKSRVIRLPFGRYQECLDLEYQYLETLKDNLFWFEKLDDLDVSTIPKQQIALDLEGLIGAGADIPVFETPGRMVGKPKSYYEQGRRYYENGLQAFGTRHHAQFCILYWMWRRNVHLDTAVRATWQWIQKRHNGFSKEFPKYPKKLKNEVVRQASHIYSNYHYRGIYPDTTHHSFYGFITKPDIEDIILLTGGSVPRAKFLFHLVKYAYPRRFRTYLNVHSDKLEKWSERNYRRYLNELDEKGIAKRGRAYLVGQFAKSINLKWPFRSSDEAVLFEGRTIDTFKDTIRFLYEPEELKSILKKARTPRQNIYHILKSIYEGKTP